MANLNFSIALNLLTDKFGAGVKRVKSGFASIRMQVMAFVAALQIADLSLTGLIGKLIDTARETNRVTTALKNISPDLNTFAKNQKWLIDLSGKYGTNVNTLTGEFAKFTAAGNLMKMPLSDQRKIFESVSRACAAFSLTADDTNSVFLALTQMMGKGKIQAQELRLQMGEKLPVAISAMAMATGGSIGKMDELMKKGQLLSKKVLPDFAEALTKLIPNVNTDNLETSIQRMNNAFVAFTKNTSVQSSYKSLIDSITSMINGAAENIKSIINEIVAYISMSIVWKLFKYIVTQASIARNKLEIEAKKAAKTAGVAFDEIAWRSRNMGAVISKTWEKIGASIKSIVMNMLPTAIITILSLIITKIYSAYQRANDISKMVKRAKEETELVGNTVGVKRLQDQLSIVNNINNKLSDRKKVLAQLNSALNTNYIIDEKSRRVNGDINKKVAERIKMLKLAAMAEYATQKEVENEDAIQQARMRTIRDRQNFNNYKNKTGVPDSVNPYNSSLNNDIFELQELLKLRTYYHKLATDSIKKLPNTNNDNTLENPTAPTKTPKIKAVKESELEKMQDDYTQQLKEIWIKYELEGTSLDDTAKAIDELHIRMMEQALSSKDAATANSDFAKQMKEYVTSKLYNAPQAELNKAAQEFYDGVSKMNTQLSSGMVTQDEYHNAIRDLATEAAKSVLSIKDIGTQGNAFVEVLKKIIGENIVLPDLKEKKNDTTFDYRKQKGEGNEEELQRITEKLQMLQDKAKETLGAIPKALDDAIKETLSEKLVKELAILKTEIKNMQKELNRTRWEGAKAMVSDLDGIISNFGQLREAMMGSGTALEKVMALWNTFASVVDTINSVSETIKTVTELTNKMGMAKKAEAVVDTMVTGNKIANAAAGAAATVGAAAVEKAANLTTTYGNIATAGSEIIKHNAKIPFVGMALAAAGLAAMFALFKSLPKFAGGGIFDGTSYSGDKGLARVNSGEMILNRSQQGRLFRAINSGRMGAYSGMKIDGKTVIKGADMYLLLNNFMKQTGKKL